MTKHGNAPEIPLPRAWPRRVKSAMLHAISLAQFALAYTRGWAANSQVARVRLKAANDQLRQHVALLTEEIQFLVSECPRGRRALDSVVGVQRRT